MGDKLGVLSAPSANFLRPLRLGVSSCSSSSGGEGLRRKGHHMQKKVKDSTHD